MTATPDLDIAHLQPNAAQPEVVVNAALDAFDAKITEAVTVVIDHTNVATLTQDEQARGSIFYLASGGSPGQSSAGTVNFAAFGMGNITVHNKTAFSATLRISGQASTPPVLGAGLVGVFYCDGLNVVAASATAYTDAQAQSAVGSISTGLSYDPAGPNIAVIRVAQIQVTDPAGDAITTGDNKAYFRINSQMNGYKLTAVAAYVSSVSTSGLPNIQVRNATTGFDMLSTPITIDANENDSSTAATPPVIDASHNTVSAADSIRIDIDGAGTGAKGLIVELTWTLP